MKRIIAITALLVTAGLVNAAPILWDFNSVDVISTNSTVADFTAAGVTEDLTGAIVQNVTGGQNMSSGGTTVSLSSNPGVYGNNTLLSYNGSSIVQDYLSAKNLDIYTAPITVTIGGLASQLTAATTYSLYLWGIGDNGDQEGTFIFNGEEKSGSELNPLTDGVTEASVYMNKFSFTTGAIVDDTLSFDWGLNDEDGGNDYAGFNGFAIVAIPEPATLGLVAAFGGGILFIRRRFMM